MSDGEFDAAMEYVAEARRIVLRRDETRRLLKRLCRRFGVPGDRMRNVKQIARAVLTIEGKDLCGHRRP